MKTECGIFSIINTTLDLDIPFILKSIQHRGQDSYGIVCRDCDEIFIIRELGLIPDNIKLPQFKSLLSHLRYSTHNSIDNSDGIQPISLSNDIYIAHNGNLPNLDNNINKLGVYSQLTSDTYLFKELWKQFNGNIEDFIIYCINNIPGAYACVIMTPTNLYGFRDRYGYKPLTFYRLNDGSSGFVSETIELSGFTGNIIELIDIRPGEVLNCYGDTIYKHTEKQLSLCSMEVVYFMNTNSLINNIQVSAIRQMIGISLAMKDTVTNAIVTYIPESSRDIAIGYGLYRSADIYDNIITKVQNIRSFIEATDEAREGKIRRKFAFNDELIKEITSLILIDDSIVRGATMRYVVSYIKNINPSIKIHLRIGCPPLINPCYFGIDISTSDELLMNKCNGSVIKMCRFLGVDSIHFLHNNDLINILSKAGLTGCNYCYGNQSPMNKNTLDW